MSPSHPTAEVDSTEAAFRDAVFNVLGYREETEWVALALELDLRGYGKTFDEALRELWDLVVTQIGFALFEGQPEMIWRAAEPVWFERFAETRRERLESLLRERRIDSPYL